ATSNLPALAPGAGSPETPTGPSPAAPAPAGPSTAEPSTQTAMLPPRPETQTPSGERPAWLRFATTAPVDMRDKPRVAIVIDDLGLDRPRTERVIALAPAVTLSFLAYSGD